MAPTTSSTRRLTHLAAVPYPGRGHINALMNLCKLLSLKNPGVLISFIVTDEWRTFLAAVPKPQNIQFLTFPNVIPSELGRADDFPGFFRSVNTVMEAPVQNLLTHLHPPPVVIVADCFLTWAVRLGNRLNIPVASFWPMSATVLSIYYHFDLLKENGHFPADLSGTPKFSLSLKITTLHYNMIFSTFKHKISASQQFSRRTKYTIESTLRPI